MTGQEEYPRFISNRPCGNDKYEGKSQLGTFSKSCKISQLIRNTLCIN